jgi:histone acetyltransferase (RNA polymerase elongator complex component)
MSDVERPPIAAVVLPHGHCLPGCPYCPVRPEYPPEQLIPNADAVPDAVRAVAERRRAAGLPTCPVEIGFYGGDLQQLPRGPRTALLDAAEAEVRGGRALSIRLTAAPRSILRAPIGEWRSRGVRAVEVPIHSLDRDVLQALGVRHAPRLCGEAVARLDRARLRTIVHLTPGLPGSSHRTALATADGIVRARPKAARILPALALEGTWLADLYARGAWLPMTVGEAVATSRHLIERLRAARVEVIRVGLQPETDLLVGPRVVAGPWEPGLRLAAEAEILRSRAAAALSGAFEVGTRRYTLMVHPAEESFARGPQSRNLRLLREQFRLDALSVLPIAGQARGTVRAVPGDRSSGEAPTPPRRPSRRAS